MALNTKHSYVNRFCAHLTSAVSSSAPNLTLYPEEITNLLAGWQPSSWLYLCLMDSAGNLEIVKMTGLSGSTLTVERGQGGTTARAWNPGALVACRAVAEYLARFLQRGKFRSGAYNPNEVLAGEYTGEKFYQTGPAVEQRRWWINTTGTKWRLLTGAPYTGEWQDEDGYWSFLPKWVNYSDPSYWQPAPTLADWDAGNQWWDTGINGIGSMYPAGSWFVGKRWNDIYIQVLQGYFAGADTFRVEDSGNHTLDVGNWAPPSEIAEEVRPLTWQGLDFGEIYADNRMAQAKFKVFVNEGAPYNPEWATLAAFNDTFWTPLVGSWNGSAWQMVWTGGGMYEIQLEAIGGWPAGEIFNRFRVTGSLPPTKTFGETRFFDAEPANIAAEGAFANPVTGIFFKDSDIATLTIRSTWHGADPGGTWLVTNIELLTEDIYS